MLITAIGVLFIGLLAGAYGANTLLATQATKLTALKAKSQALNEEQASLTKANKDIKTYAPLENITHAVVPEDKNQAEAVREIVNIAAANTIGLASITFPASTLGTGATAVAATPSTSTPAALPPAAGSSKTTGLSQLKAVPGLSGVYQLLINIEGDTNKPVPYAKFVNFLNDLEHNRRTAQVSNIAITPNTDDRNLLTFTLSLNEYIKP